MGTQSNDIEDLPDLDGDPKIKHRIRIDISDVNPKALVRTITTDIPEGFSQYTGAKFTTKLDLNLDGVAMGYDEQVEVEIRLSDQKAYFLGETTKDGVTIKMPISGGSSKTKNLIRHVKWDKSLEKPRKVTFLCTRTKDFKGPQPFNVGIAVEDGEYTMPVIYDPDVKNDG